MKILNNNIPNIKSPFVNFVLAPPKMAIIIQAITRASRQNSRVNDINPMLIPIDANPNPSTVIRMNIASVASKAAFIASGDT